MTVTAEQQGDDTITPARVKEYYNTKGNKTKVVVGNSNTESGNQVAVYQYNKVNEIISVTDPEGNTTQTTYNYRGQPVRVTNALENSMYYGYDPKGRLVEITDYKNNVTNNFYDAANRLIKMTAPVNNTQTAQTNRYYDSNSNLTHEKTLSRIENGAEIWNENEYTYTARNQIASVNIGGLEYTEYEYTPAGKVSALKMGLTNPHSTTYGYNSWGQLINITDPLDKTESFVYNYLGNVIQKTDREGNITETEYTALGQPSVVLAYNPQNIANQLNITYGYDISGNLINIADNNSEISYEYDEYSRLITETAADYTNAYTYNKNNNRASYTMTANGSVQIYNAYTYDSLNRLKTVINDDVLTGYGYDANGNISSETSYDYYALLLTSQMNVLNSASYEYNKANQVTSLSTNAGYESYSYNLDGNQASKNVTNTLSSAYYEYDGAGRLTREKVVDPWDETNSWYYYDEYGNRKQQYTLDFTMDVSTVSYNYNLLDKFTGGVIEKEGESTEFEYEYYPNGMRKSKTVNDETIKYIWDGQNIVGEMDETGAVTAKYIRGNGLITRKTGSAKQFYNKNAHGDIVSLTNPNGSVANRYDYDAWGNLNEENSFENAPQPFQYSGEYHDGETNLYYLRNRYYDAKIGRFTQEDPIRSGQNWYVYCGNNPIRYVDPSGLTLKLNKNDFDEFTKQARDIYGNQDLEFSYEKKGSFYYISEWGDWEYEGGSEVGRALLQAVITDKMVIDFSYNYDIDSSRETSGYNSYSLTLHMNAWGDENYSREERNSSLIHELGHVYTSTITGYDRLLSNATSASPLSFELLNGYQEATAITLEERFREEMGYAGRGTQTTLMINGTYGFWPHLLKTYSTEKTNSLIGAFSGMCYGVSLMQSLYIDYDVVNRYRN
jgi:RHS repeat-associated protein